MNSLKTAEQDRFHSELRLMCYEKYAGRGELHHIFGSRYRRRVFDEEGKRVKYIGEWLVILLPADLYKRIKEFSFEDEREAFLMQKPVYEEWYEKPFPVPEAVIESYKAMKHRHEIEKGLGYGL